jgi:hypothetical protein
MSVGLPSHLARAANSRALATGARWAALVCLGAALVNVGVSSFAQGSAYSWMALLSLLPMAGLLVLLARRRTVVLTVVYLLVGGLCTFFYALALFEDNSSYRDTNLFVLALPIVAMTLVGGTSTGALAGILWASAGFALAEVAMFFAASAAGRTFRTDAISLGAYLLLVGILTFNGLARGSRSRSQSAIHRAIRHSRLIALRRDLIADVTALLHDSVLSELLAIANADAGVLSPKLRDRLEADLRELGRDPTPAFPTPAFPTAAFATPALGTPALATSGDGWFDSELHAAIELARDEGLAVDLSGDRNALALLSLERRRAVGLAARQCLVNVLRHSGSATAEVAISSSADAVSVMVVDAGRGFAPTSTASDRLGLRQSVRERIERVGGTVTVYSSPNVGTTVMIAVPTGEAEGVIAL